MSNNKKPKPIRISEISDFFDEGDVLVVPFLPLRNTVIFPNTVSALTVRREFSMHAIEKAFKNKRMIFCVAQRSVDDDLVEEKHVFQIGTLARIREINTLDDGSIRAVLEGVARAKIRKIFPTDDFVSAEIIVRKESIELKNEETEALMFSVVNQFRRVVNMGINVPFDLMLVVMNILDPMNLADIIATNIDLPVEEKQLILEAVHGREKLLAVSVILGKQIKLLQIASKIQAETGKELDKMQREIFLREQMKSIERELEDMGAKNEPDDLSEKLFHCGIPKDLLPKIKKEYDRFKSMPAWGPESGYLRAYLECVASLPWNKNDSANIDLEKAKKILDNEHDGLEKVKDRILEFLAVSKLAGKSRGSILCFVGPPGTGKTSLGKSIARSMGRKFVRVSLGGVHDEAEIRGHRRTYVGALPGRIIQGIIDAGTKNPVVMLDEIDKIGSDFRGDPGSALLEALDSEQNSEFKDHYLDLPFDLSDVVFIATANLLDTVPPALFDRLEILRFAGYTDNEKLNIAKHHLIPELVKDHGLEKNQVKFEPAAILKVMREYTREAGVRNLERMLSKIVRKIVRVIVTKSDKSSLPLLESESQNRRLLSKEEVVSVVDAAAVAKYLGPIDFEPVLANRVDEVGLVTGLAWTEAGGEILSIEVTKMPGKGTLILTGQLGSVMQESAQAAFTYARSVVEGMGVSEPFYKESDIHIHVPGGAIPKDGPSAGAAMATGIISLLTNKKIRRDVGMTGEVTLRGRVLEIGGLKEKVLAANRAGLKTIVLPKENAKDLIDIPDSVKKNMKFVFVSTMPEVLKVVLMDK